MYSGVKSLQSNDPLDTSPCPHPARTGQLRAFTRQERLDTAVVEIFGGIGVIHPLTLPRVGGGWWCGIYSYEVGRYACDGSYAYIARVQWAHVGASGDRDSVKYGIATV